MVVRNHYSEKTRFNQSFFGFRWVYQISMITEKDRKIKDLIEPWCKGCQTNY